jgi:YfiH family protein
MSLATSHRVETGPAGTWLVVPGFGAPHCFGTKHFTSRGTAAIDGRAMITARQVHKDGVLVVDGTRRDWGALQDEASATDADALATASPECWIGVSTADCLPLLLHDPDRGAVAAVHAGWRGALMGVAPAALRCLIERFGARAGRVEAAIGPHIGACCFEVGRAVLDPLAAGFPGWTRWVDRRAGEKGYFDLRGFVRRQLEEMGMAPERIHAVDRCTRCESDLFSSYRRDGRAPRGMLSAIRPADPISG